MAPVLVASTSARTAEGKDGNVMESIKGVVIVVSMAILLGIGWNVQLRLPEARIDQPLKFFSKELPLKNIATAVEDPSFVDGALNGSVACGKVFSGFLQNTWGTFWDTVDKYWRKDGRGVLMSLVYVLVVFIFLMIVMAIGLFFGFFMLLWACVVIHASISYYVGLFLACAFWLAFFYILTRERQPSPTAGENASLPEHSS